MQNHNWKYVAPCSIVAVCIMLPLLLAWIPQPTGDIDSIFDELQSTADLPHAEARFNQYVSFLEEVSNPSLRRSIYSIRFDAAEVLSQRDDLPGYAAALQQYQYINQQDPSYNYGWLQFMMAETLQKLEKWDDAASAYAKVPFYNHSRLALRAKFLQAMIQSEKLNQPVSSQAVYTYLRFASEYPLSDAALASNWQWTDGQYAGYIKALAQHDAGNDEEALRLMQIDNNDPSTEYYAGLFGKPILRSLPAALLVLQSAYYDGSLVSGSVMMEEGYSLLSDFYANNNTPCKLELHYTTAVDFIPTFEVYVNQTKIDTVQHRSDLQIVSADVVPKAGKNSLEIRWYQTNRQVNPPSPLSVYVHELKVQ